MILTPMHAEIESWHMDRPKRALYYPLPKYGGPSVEIARSMTLKDLVANYSKSFPLVVRVCEGCFVSEEDAVSTDDIYVLHSVKPTRAVLVQTWFHSSCYKQLIPVVSDIEVGLVAERTTPQIISTVGDVMAATNLPLVLCATKSYDSGSEDSSVQASEVLIVKKVARSLRSFGHRVLMVHSVTKDREKTLQQHCAGFFSTDPLKTKMALSNLLTHANIPFPVTAQVFGSPSGATNLPSHFCCNVVTLVTLVESQSVIAACFDKDTIPDSESCCRSTSGCIELSVDLPICVSLYREEFDPKTSREIASTPSPYLNVFNDLRELDNTSDTAVEECASPTYALSKDIETQPLISATCKKFKWFPTDDLHFPMDCSDLASSGVSIVRSAQSLLLLLLFSICMHGGAFVQYRSNSPTHG